MLNNNTLISYLYINNLTDYMSLKLKSYIAIKVVKGFFMFYS